MNAKIHQMWAPTVDKKQHFFSLASIHLQAKHASILNFNHFIRIFSSSNYNHLKPM